MNVKILIFQIKFHNSVFISVIRKSCNQIKFSIIFYKFKKSGGIADIISEDEKRQIEKKMNDDFYFILI
jgi:hypothetical protein